jgi:hypothetical protein
MSEVINSYNRLSREFLVIRQNELSESIRRRIMFLPYVTGYQEQKLVRELEALRNEYDHNLELLQQLRFDDRDEKVYGDV